MIFEFSYKAERQLGEFPQHVQQRIRDKLRFYVDQENPISFAKKLTDRYGYRFRVGDHRVIFLIENNIIKILKIEPRDKAYE